MFILIAVVLISAGAFLALFNFRIALFLSGGPRSMHDNFLTSTARQNVAFVGGACLFGGLLFFYLR
jgi:hypothetical protein